MRALPKVVRVRARNATMGTRIGQLLAIQARGVVVAVHAVSFPRECMLEGIPSLCVGWVVYEHLLALEVGSRVCLVPGKRSLSMPA